VNIRGDDLRDKTRRFVLPARRPERRYPRAVKIKMSNYARIEPLPDGKKPPDPDEEPRVCSEVQEPILEPTAQIG
jgi:hypothetical protein